MFKRPSNLGTLDYSTILLAVVLVYGKYTIKIIGNQKAKPTPLLVMEQSEESVNVSFRPNPRRSPSMNRPISE